MHSIIDQSRKGKAKLEFYVSFCIPDVDDIQQTLITSYGNILIYVHIFEYPR